MDRNRQRKQRRERSAAASADADLDAARRRVVLAYDLRTTGDSFAVIARLLGLRSREHAKQLVGKGARLARDMARRGPVMEVPTEGEA